MALGVWKCVSQFSLSLEWLLGALYSPQKHKPSLKSYWRNQNLRPSRKVSFIRSTNSKIKIQKNKSNPRPSIEEYESQATFTLTHNQSKNNIRCNKISKKKWKKPQVSKTTVPSWKSTHLKKQSIKILKLSEFRWYLASQSAVRRVKSNEFGQVFNPRWYAMQA